MTQLARKLSTSPQAISRHLSRLEETRIIEKDSDGCFVLTQFGKAVLLLLPSLNFITQHRKFFLSHDITSLPIEFVERIGELEHGKPGTGIGSVLRCAADVIGKAEEYVWLVSDKAIDLTPFGVKEAGKNVSFRLIAPAAENGVSLETVEVGRDKMEIRLAQSVKAGIAMNEKIAGLLFPSLNGQIDFNGGFSSDDPSFHKWCADLFMFYWNNAKPRIK